MINHHTVVAATVFSPNELGFHIPQYLKLSFVGMLDVSVATGHNNSNVKTLDITKFKL